MKRKLIKRNKSRISKHLMLQRKNNNQKVFDTSRITIDSITRSKQLGQRCHQTRLERQRKMNSRQLKKLRKKQRISGVVGSKYGTICKTQLQPALANLFRE